MKNKKIILMFSIPVVLFITIVLSYNNKSLNNIVGSNHRLNTDEFKKIETVKGSKLKIGDYVNYDHTLEVPEDKLRYTSVKGDLKNPGNGDSTQTVDVSYEKNKWRVYDTQGDQVLLMPASSPKATIKSKSALGYLWYEKEAHNIAGLYGHGFGADETKSFEYQVGSRIPSENDTKTEHTQGTGARPLLLSDIEKAYNLTKDKKQELNDFNQKDQYPIGSNKLEGKKYYPTLNEANARATEEKLKEMTGDIGVSIAPKELKDIKHQQYTIKKRLNELHTSEYNKETGKDVLKDMIHAYSSQLGTRIFDIYSTYMNFSRSSVGIDYIEGGSKPFGSNQFDFFRSYNYSELNPRPIVYLSVDNKYYKEKGNGEFATYSLIKEEKVISKEPKVQNPYNAKLEDLNLKIKDGDTLLYEGKLNELPDSIDIPDLIRADGTKVIGDMTYTVEGLPGDITYYINKKEIEGKEKITIQIYPKELNVLANISKKDIYDGAKYTYDISINKNGNKLSTDQLDETKDGKVVIAKYTNREDIIDEEGNKVEHTLEFDNFNDTVRKDNTYYINTFAKDDKSNINEIVYNLNIVYDKAKYDEVVKNIKVNFADIETKINTLATEEETKKGNIDTLTPKVGEAEKKGKVTIEEKQGLVDELSKIEERQKANETEAGNLKTKLEKLTEDNKNTIDNNNELKTKKEELTNKISELETGIKIDSKIIKGLKARIDKIGTYDKEKLTADLGDIEKRTNTLENNDKTKKNDITKLEEEVKIAETNGGTDELGKKKLDEGIASIKKRQNDEKAERDSLEKELQDLIAGNPEALKNEKDLKEKADALTQKISDLKGTIEKDDEKIKELEDRIAKIKVVDFNDIDKLNERIKQLQKEIADNNKQLEQDKLTIKRLEELRDKIIADNTKEQAKINEEIAKIKKSNEDLENENKSLETDITKLTSELEQLKGLEQDKKELEKKKADLESKLFEAEAKQKELEKDLKKCGNNTKALKEKLDALKKIYDENEEKIKKLEQEKKDIEARNKELEEKNKLSEEELKEKELLKKKLAELEEKANKLEKEKEKLANDVMDKEKPKNNANENNSNNENIASNTDNNKTKEKEGQRNNQVKIASNKKANKKNNTSNSNIPHAGAESLIILSLITIVAIIYTKKVISKK